REIGPARSGNRIYPLEVPEVAAQALLLPGRSNRALCLAGWRDSRQLERPPAPHGRRRKENRIEAANMIDRWERAVPVYNVPIWTKSFKALMGLGGIAFVLTLYREIAGLGPASGMNDAYAWGIWKTFNVMTLTGLGSGAFAIGICAWIFKKNKLHTVMRVALLTSFLAYLSGLIMIGIDVGRPWNVFWLFTPWNWNPHS